MIRVRASVPREPVDSTVPTVDYLESSVPEPGGVIGVREGAVDDVPPAVTEVVPRSGVVLCLAAGQDIRRVVAVAEVEAVAGAAGDACARG